MSVPALPGDYVDTYRTMLKGFGQASHIRTKEFVAIWPMCGRDYQSGRGLLLVGRAPADWEESCAFVRQRAAQDAEAQRILTATQNPGFGLEFVTDAAGPSRVTHRKDSYNSNRSAFWSTAHRITDELGLIANREAWTQSIAWTNLYKLAPHRKPPKTGGNPSWQQRVAQRDGCCRLLQSEIEAWRPAVVLLMTDSDWWDGFNEPLGSPTSPVDGRFVKAAGKQNGRQWVVTCRPEAKGHDAFVSEVLASLGR